MWYVSWEGFFFFKNFRLYFKWLYKYLHSLLNFASWLQSLEYLLSGPLQFKFANFCIIHILHRKLKWKSLWWSLVTKERFTPRFFSRWIMVLYFPMSKVNCSFSFLIGTSKSSQLSLYQKNSNHFCAWLSKLKVIQFLFDYLDWWWSQPFLFLFGHLRTYFFFFYSWFRQHSSLFLGKASITGCVLGFSVLELGNLLFFSDHEDRKIWQLLLSVVHRSPGLQRSVGNEAGIEEPE